MEEKALLDGVIPASDEVRRRITRASTELSLLKKLYELAVRHEARKADLRREGLAYAGR